ncbi:tRNA pseudouridine(55) synthase TruB [Candidatus Gracilibacteria bacterium]|nr:tRNA pseudouridine(55) synthase TruB [Candidatus Gracilibacteria bacterium]PIQ11999.1 MAG: tRNA pseudouridine(55) synthase TruB [Candidatus Gracilibacteria bacterium CG18_big_fil_WC_8_21_14_2_50_38_16]PIQ41058.1 MAG: tRNA pseudouridine(55) synthase TruB [Candidatus Gracilibacteria bacterium CG12_big_fil_rev_8_21_14_0_65_38_15]
MFFLIQKPYGLSSFSAIAHLRKKFGIKKIGHTGTLDPLATGLLLVATDNSTKLISYIDKARKSYVFTVRLDGSTPSYDLDTPVEYLDVDIVEKARTTLTKEIIEHTIQTYFFGKIEQIPPSYSAIRLQGQRAYHMVRAGQEVQISKREIEIFSTRLVSFSFPEVTIEMEVSVGTYIRSIARDIGEKLGLAGHVTMLHRNKIEHLDEILARKIEDITLEDTLSYDCIFPGFEIISPEAEILEKLYNGLVFSNTIGLESGKKYLVKNGDKYISLIEERDGMVRICANNIE